MPETPHVIRYAPLPSDTPHAAAVYQCCGQWFYQAPQAVFHLMCSRPNARRPAMRIRRNRKKRALTMRSLQHIGVDLRVALLVRSRGNCWYCGTPLTLATMTADHLVPVKHGGLTTLDNLVACCEPCNLAKGHRTLEEFRRLRGVDLFGSERGRDDRT